MNAWYRKAVRNVAPRQLWLAYTGGVFNGLLHTTETRVFHPRADSYYGHTSYPHFTVAQHGGKWRVFQHIPITHAARALKNLAGGVQTNTDKVIQIEIAWTAADGYKLPRKAKKVLRRLMAWCERQTGIKPVPAPQGFHDATTRSYLARQNNGIRFSGSAWTSFRGWCGHQHAPENDHWDPGRLDMEFLLRRSTPRQVIKRLRRRVRRLRAKLARAKSS